MDEKQSAKMHPDWGRVVSGRMMMIRREQSAMVLPTRDLFASVVLGVEAQCRNESGISRLLRTESKRARHR